MSFSGNLPQNAGSFNDASLLGVIPVDGLSDATVTTPVDGDVLEYDAGTSEWVNVPIGGVGAVQSVTNIGGGEGVSAGLVGTDLQLKSLADTSNIDFSSTATEISADLASTITVDSINERTGAAGVNIEGINITDNRVDATGAVDLLLRAATGNVRAERPIVIEFGGGTDTTMSSDSAGRLTLDNGMKVDSIEEFTGANGVDVDDWNFKNNSITSKATTENQTITAAGTGDFKIDAGTGANSFFIDNANGGMAISATGAMSMISSGGQIDVEAGSADTVKISPNATLENPNTAGSVLLDVDASNDLLVGGVVNLLTTSNVGAGSNVFKAKSGTNASFRSIIGGTGINATENTNDITIDLNGTISVDTINESTTNNGVSIDGVLLKDNDIQADDIRDAAGTGRPDFSLGLKVGSITERIAANGVQVEGMKFVDNTITSVGGSTTRITSDSNNLNIRTITSGNITFESAGGSITADSPLTFNYSGSESIGVLGGNIIVGSQVVPLNGTDLGGTAGTFKAKSGTNLQFRGISAGTGITVVENANDITISTNEDLKQVWYGPGQLRVGSSIPAFKIDSNFFSYMEFDTGKDVIVQFRLPDDYTDGDDIVVSPHWYTSDTSGNNTWQVESRKNSVGSARLNTVGDTDSTVSAVPGVANTIVKTDITVAGTGFVSGDIVNFKVELTAKSGAKPAVIGIGIQY